MNSFVFGTSAFASSLIFLVFNLIFIYAAKLSEDDVSHLKIDLIWTDIQSTISHETMCCCTEYRHGCDVVVGVRRRYNRKTSSVILLFFFTPLLQTLLSPN